VLNPVLTNLGLLVLGMALLSVGGKFLVDAAVNIAARLGVPALLVGLTIVAWGTSAPELAFNGISAWNDRGPLVLGNVVGANICNLGLIVGVCALIRPLAVADDIVRRELPLTGVLFALLLVLALAGRSLGRADGAVLLVVFAAYSAWTIRQGLSRRAAAASEIDEQVARKEADDAPRLRPLPVAITALVIGLALLGMGGSLAADGAVGIARAVGIPESVVGLTIVSIGTTLPEFMTGVIATRKGHVDLAIGNVVGSSLFNVGAVLGVAGLVVPTPIEVTTHALVSIGVMVGLGLLLLPMSRTFHRTIARIEGLALLGVYAAFLVYQAWTAARAAGAGGP
jgi:cation:H+ antiporter